MTIQKPIQEADFEQAVEQALEELQVSEEGARALEKEQPIENGSHRDLIKRSRQSFANHLDQLHVRTVDVQQRIAEAGAVRDEQIRQANAAHAAFMAEAEKDLYQISTLRSAVELAHAALERANDE